MSTTCKYCLEPEDKQSKPGLVCEKCDSLVHLSCLRSLGTPGDFTNDVFFDFTCQDCSAEKKEMFIRNKFPWVNVILLTLHHLSVQSYGISNHGFFHYKTHICSFIDRNWFLLFGMTCKQKKNWVGTIAGVLSVYNNLLFKSGSVVLGEPGWWKLLHNFSPAVAAHIIQEMAKHKPKGRPRSQMALDKALFTSKVAVMGYQDLINNEAETTIIEPVNKKRRVDSDDSSASYCEQGDSDCKTEPYEEGVMEESARQETYSDVVVYPSFYDSNASYVLPSDSSSIHSYQQNTMFYDSDSRSRSPYHEQHSEEDQKPDVKQLQLDKKKPEEKELQDEKRDSLFSSELNSTELPWVEKKEEVKKDLVEMTPYEEIQLLKQVEALIPKVKDPNKKSYLYRFRAKLALRRLKRHKHLPIFDLDKTVKLLSGCATEDPRVAINIERVLDRFQRSYLLDNLSGTVSSPWGGAVIVPGGWCSTVRAHSGANLPPYIRRDTTAHPAWLRITDQLLTKTHRHIPNYKPPPHLPLDYCYVRPQHIPAVNTLLAQFFWPGIDISEALEYPEYSCVVMYGKLVVACAFLVPDVGPHQAYVSFILTRPEWRNAGIATFMLYHLLQTCTGKDVTLHVSPTNPAIFLYQKFGFKVEELIQDFYEKYYDIDYKGCRHALFLRLVR